MNCFILFLLLRCCGWGSGCGCRTERSGCGCGRGMSGRGCCEGMGSGRNDSCGRDMGRQQECCECREERRGCGCEDIRNDRGGCGCEDVRNDRGGCEEERRGCGCGREEDRHDHDGCGCTERENNSDSSGMIPPPWQDYPRFPRRDNGNECDS